MAQVKQWKQCQMQVEEHEKERGMKFTAVAKLRPDDHWYGPILPWCALDLGTTAYFAMAAASEKAQARDNTVTATATSSDRASLRRWSDQFFVLPRSSASRVMRLYDDMMAKGEIFCKDGVATMNHETKGSSFEQRVFGAALAAAAEAKTHVVGLALPRVLGRELGKWKGARHSQEVRGGGAVCLRRPAASLFHRPAHSRPSGGRTQLADVSAKCHLFLPFVEPSRCFEWTLGTHAAG